MRVRAVLLGVALLAGCDQLAPVEVMPLAEARANLVHIAGSGSADAFCTEQGRTEFRTAVRNFTAAADAAGEKTQAFGMSSVGDEAWGLVGMGVMARIVEPSDLRGDLQSMAYAMNFPGATVPGLSDTRDAMAQACPELVRLYRAMADYAELQRMAPSYRDDSRERQQRFSERMERSYENIRRTAEALERKMRASGWEGPPNTFALSGG